MSQETRVMTHRIMLAAVVFAAGCGAERMAYEAPPAASYDAGTHEMRTSPATFSVQGARVTPEFFTTAQVSPMLGRLFTDADYRPSGRPVVVISYEIWVERFASVPGVIGESIEIDQSPVTVVGVMPRGFTFPETTHFWTPSRVDGAAKR
jgi:hypothetical protein